MDYQTSEFWAADQKAYEERQAKWEREHATPDPMPVSPLCHPSRQSALTGNFAAGDREPEAVLVSGWLVEAYRNWYDEFGENA